MKPQYLRTRVLERAAAEGRRIVYLQPTLYPAIEVQVQILEASREQLFDLERALLELCAAGVGSADELAFALGLRSHRLLPLLLEAEHRGLLERPLASAPYRPTELGLLSLRHGAALLRSTRAVLLCAITGAPLPAPAYEATTYTPAELSKVQARDYGLMVEAPAVSLRHLHVEAIADKRAVNLPDELVAVEGVVAGSCAPRYVEALLEFSALANGAPSCTAYFGDMRLPATWLTLEQALGLVEPLGFPQRTPEQVLQVLATDLAEQGARGVRAGFDGFGNPVLSVRDGAPPLFRFRADDNHLVFHMGVADFTPVPVARYYAQLASGARSELLRGRTLTAFVEPGGELEPSVRASRVLWSANVECRKRRASARERAEILQQALARHRLTRADAQTVAELCGRPDLLAGL